MKNVDSARNFVTRFIGFSSGPLIASLIGFLILPVVTRFLAPDEFGKASIYTLAVNIIVMLVLLGLDQSYVREYHTVSSPTVLFKTVFIIPFAVSVACCLLCIFFYRPLSLFLFESIEKDIMVLLGLLIPVMVLNKFLSLHIRMQEKSFTYSAYAVIQKVVYTGFLIVLLLLGDRTFSSIVYATFFSSLSVVVVQLIVYHKLLLNMQQIDTQLLKQSLSFGIPLVPAALLMWVLNSMDQVALKIWSDYHAIGIYAAAFRFVIILTIVKQGFVMFWIPTAYRWHEQKESFQKFDKIAGYLTFIMTGIFLVMVAGKEMLIQFFDIQYRNAVTIVPFLLLIPVMYTLASASGMGIGFARKTRFSLLIVAVAAVCNVIGNTALVPAYGALGASLATGVSFVVYFLLTTFISRSLWYKFPLGTYFINISIMCMAASVQLIIANIWVNSLIICVYLLVNSKIMKELFSDLYKIRLH